MKAFGIKSMLARMGAVAGIGLTLLAAGCDLDSLGVASNGVPLMKDPAGIVEMNGPAAPSPDGLREVGIIGQGPRARIIIIP